MSLSYSFFATWQSLGSEKPGLCFMFYSRSQKGPGCKEMVCAYYAPYRDRTVTRCLYILRDLGELGVVGVVAEPMEPGEQERAYLHYAGTPSREIRD